MGLDVYFSIYWSRWNTWTLVPLTIFVYEGGKCSLRFEDAIRANHMASLGDFTLATIPPLRFRIHTQESKQRKVEKDGTGKFSIGGIEMLCVNKKIQNPLEQSIAFFLMLYGDWPSNLGEANIANGELIYFDFVSEPNEPSQEQPFQMIGTMSSIITRRFNSLTVREGEIDKFSPRSLESDLGITIPDDYEGEDLNLWRFVLEPGSKEAKP